MSDTPDEPTTETEPVEPEPAPPSEVRTVTRNGAALGMAACLVVGLLLGWAVSAATSDDDPETISFQERFERGRGEGGWRHRGPEWPGGGGFPEGGWGEDGPWGDFDRGDRPPWFGEERSHDEGDEEPAPATTEG